MNTPTFLQDVIYTGKKLYNVQYLGHFLEFLFKILIILSTIKSFIFYVITQT